MANTSLPHSNGDWAALIQSTTSAEPIAQLLKQTTSSDLAEITSASISSLSAEQVASYIDHTLLALTATSAEIGKLCEEARQNLFRTVCVRVDKVKQSADLLLKSQKGGLPGIAAVVGFHEGTYTTHSKCQEARTAVEHGASELDMVLNYEHLKEGKYVEVYHDIKAVRDAADQALSASPAGLRMIGLKVILETSQLTPEQVIAGSVISIRAGADFVKTSTGFRGRGATIEDVQLMKAVCDVEEFQGPSRSNGKAKVKASGGVRTIDDFLKMIDAGAERIGASAGVKILDGLRGKMSGKGKDTPAPAGTDAY